MAQLGDTIIKGDLNVIGNINGNIGSTSLGQGYGVCSTEASTTSKSIILSDYILKIGGIVAIKFTYDVPANSTMNINSNGAKNIFFMGSPITAGIIKAGDLVTFMYDGNQYHLLSIDRWGDLISKISIE